MNIWGYSILDFWRYLTEEYRFQPTAAEQILKQRMSDPAIGVMI